MKNWNDVFDAVLSGRKIIFTANESKYIIVVSGIYDGEVTNARYYIKKVIDLYDGRTESYYYAGVMGYNSEVLEVFTMVFFKLVETEIRFDQVTIEQEEPEVNHV